MDAVQLQYQQEQLFNTHEVLQSLFLALELNQQRYDFLEGQIWQHVRPSYMRLPFTIPHSDWTLDLETGENIRRLTRLDKGELHQLAALLWPDRPMLRYDRNEPRIKKIPMQTLFCVFKRLPFADRWYSQITRMGRLLMRMRILFNQTLKALYQHWSQCVH